MNSEVSSTERPPGNVGTRSTKWRPFRFSLKTFLIAITIFSIWLGLNLNRARIQRQSLEQLHTSSIGYSYQYIPPYGLDETRQPSIPAWLFGATGKDFFYRVVYVNLNGASASAERLKALDGLTGLRMLGLDNAEITLETADAIGRMRRLEVLSLQMCTLTPVHVSRFKGLSRIQDLSLAITNIGDDGLRYIGQLQDLRRLHLQHTNITDEGLKHLVNLTKVETLILSDNQKVTDAGLVNLLPLRNLKNLSLWKNKNITDDALSTLGQLKSLQKLDLSGTKVSNKAEAELQNSLPGIKLGTL